MNDLEVYCGVVLHCKMRPVALQCVVEVRYAGKLLHSRNKQFC